MLADLDVLSRYHNGVGQSCSNTAAYDVARYVVNDNGNFINYTESGCNDTDQDDPLSSPCPAEYSSSNHGGESDDADDEERTNIEVDGPGGS